MTSIKGGVNNNEKAKEHFESQVSFTSMNKQMISKVAQDLGYKETQ